jgi:hypothetical protein
LRYTFGMQMRAFVVLVLLAACGDKPSPSTAPAGKMDPQAEAKKLEAQVAAVAGALPEGLAITFAPVVVDEGRVIALAPAGWEPGALPGTTRPPESASLGFMTQMALGTSCDGVCSPKDWAEAAERVDLAPLRGSDFTVVKDEDLGGSGRVLVSKTLDRTFVVVVRWDKAGSRYGYCRVTLDQEVAGAAAAFEQACRTMQVLTWQ